MVVVSDTTAISNLLKLGKLYYIQNVFGQIVIPVQVYEELLQLAHSGYKIDAFTEAAWISVSSVEENTLFNQLSKKLDKGETAAIVLAHQNNANFLIMDEKKGRIEAENLGIKTIGLLGILIQCRRLNVCNSLKQEMDTLREKAGFWINESLYKQVISLEEQEFGL